MYRLKTLNVFEKERETKHTTPSSLYYNYFLARTNYKTGKNLSFIISEKKRKKIWFISFECDTRIIILKNDNKISA